MALAIYFRPRARRDLLELPAQVQARIIQHLERMAADPSVSALPRLKGRWRQFSKLRVGDYRVILRVAEDRLTVATLGHRGSIYDKLSRLGADETT